MRNIQMFAVEPQLDGTDHVFGPEYAEKMRLPFDRGWDHWAIYDGPNKIFQSPNYEEVQRELEALMVLLAS